MLVNQAFIQDKLILKLVRLVLFLIIISITLTEHDSSCTLHIKLYFFARLSLL